MIGTVAWVVGILAGTALFALAAMAFAAGAWAAAALFTVLLAVCMVATIALVEKHL